MLTTALIGLPRVGPDRELKDALERHWAGEIPTKELRAVAAAIRTGQLDQAAGAGIDVLPSNDFSLYDHVLDMALAVGAVPERFDRAGLSGLDRYFAMARGGGGARPLQMTKWLDTNYHHLVPEIGPRTAFAADPAKALAELREAATAGLTTRPVLLGPVSLLLLSRNPGGDGEPLDELDRLLAVYAELLAALAEAGARAVQIDEPCLVRDLGERELQAIERAWTSLAAAGDCELTLATYFGTIGDALARVLALPITELHLDLVRAPEQLATALELTRPGQRLSLGLIDGRNVWAADLDAAARLAAPAIDRLGSDRVRLAPSCSLLHVPYTAAREQRLDPQLRAMLAFGVEKLGELTVLRDLLDGTVDRTGRKRPGRAFDHDPRPQLVEWSVRPGRPGLTDHSTSGESFGRDPAVRERAAHWGEHEFGRDAPFERRAAAQRERLDLPELPTTTIGSFPQTPAIRAARRDHTAGTLGDDAYGEFLRDEIRSVIAFQEEIGLDVLVHGEPERNDMVQYFAERMRGFAATEHGWVQSYGSRCVKPPLLYGDISRPEPVTVDWWRFAQSLTGRPVKAILTGPVTMLNWSFVRSDQPREETCRQLALAIADEAADLERAGAPIIQVDEAALREGMPLRGADRAAYLRWAVDCFRLTVAELGEETQVHAHMCYSTFEDVVEHVARMDADVVSIEASRGEMEILQAFAAGGYPNAIGPGVWDVHSPRIPLAEEISALLEKAERLIGRERLWVNPDCGLKTRTWEQTDAALRNLVAAARQRRTAVADVVRG